MRAAGAITSIAIWLGVLVFALDNLDTGLPRSEGLMGGWPFFIVAPAVAGGVALFLNRRPGKPGWFHFVIGLLIPEVAFFVNRLASNADIGPLLWTAVAILVLIPLPARPPAG